MAIYNTVLSNAQESSIGLAVPGAGYTLTDTTIEGQAARLLVPRSYNAMRGAPLIIYHHGAGENYTALTTDTLKWTCVMALLAAGYILAGSSAHGDNDGNSQGLADYTALYTYMMANYAITRLAGWGQSFGGISSLLSLVTANPYEGWLGTYPACNLRWMFDNGFAPSIKPAFGIAGDGSDYDAKTAGHDPLLLDASVFNNFRMRFYASPSDTIVAKTHNTDAMVTLVAGHATECDVVACTGEHGDPSHFQPTDYVSFFNRCV